MHVRFWGTRGSIAAPGPATARYGGNTSCVEVRASDGTVIILDCGTGARELGLHLAQTLPRPMRLHLFIGHTHWDHIQGFPFFVPAFLPGSELNIYAPFGFQRGLEEAMAGQMEYSYFPVKMRDLRSRIHFTELDEGFFRVGNVLVETQFMNHTAPTVAYRMTGDGATVVYATDHEPFWNASGRVSQHPGDERHITFLRGANLVIHDAQYTGDEYRDKVGWGHSSIEYAVDVALAAGVERLVLFHHDPAHDDDMMETMEAMARSHVGRRGQALDVLAAREGMELSVVGSGLSPAVGEASALQHRQIAGGRVLVVSANEAECAEIEEILSDDGLILLRHSDMRAVLARGHELTPDIAIVDRELLDGDGDPTLVTLRDRLGRRELSDHRPGRQLDSLRRGVPGRGALDRLSRQAVQPAHAARAGPGLAGPHAHGARPGRARPGRASIAAAGPAPTAAPAARAFSPPSRSSDSSPPSSAICC